MLPHIDVVPLKFQPMKKKLNISDPVLEWQLLVPSQLLMGKILNDNKKDEESSWNTKCFTC